MTLYHYVECGLDNVHVEGLKRESSPYGGDQLIIPQIKALHLAIAAVLVNKPSKLTGPEIRFLRVMAQAPQQAFGEALDREGLAVSRWERGRNTPDACTEAILRQVVAEGLQIELRAGPAALIDWCRTPGEITITLYRTESGYSEQAPPRHGPRHGHRHHAAAA